MPGFFNGSDKAVGRQPTLNKLALFLPVQSALAKHA
jgi:hypothetical protein